MLFLDYGVHVNVTFRKQVVVITVGIPIYHICVGRYVYNTVQLFLKHQGWIS